LIKPGELAVGTDGNDPNPISVLLEAVASY